MKKFYLVTFILSLLGLTVNLLNDYQKIELIDGDCHVFVTESKFTKKVNVPNPHNIVFTVTYPYLRLVSTEQGFWIFKSHLVLEVLDEGLEKYREITEGDYVQVCRSDKIFNFSKLHMV